MNLCQTSHPDVQAQGVDSRHGLFKGVSVVCIPIRSKFPRMNLVRACMLLLRNSFSCAPGRWSPYEYHYISTFRGGKDIFIFLQTMYIPTFNPRLVRAVCVWFYVLICLLIVHKSIK